MHMHKQIKKKLIINYVSQDKHKLIIKLPSPPKCKDKLELKWKNKDYLSIKELIKQYSQTCILIVKCGKKEEIKLRFIFKDLLEDGSLVN